MHFLGGSTLPPPQVHFYDSAPTGGIEPTPNKVFLHADSIFNVFIWIWRRQSTELTPIGTGKQSDDFARSPFSLGNVAIRKSVKKTWLGHIFVTNWRPNQKVTFWAGLPSPLKYSSMILVPREAQNLLQTRFFCMLIPFYMFLFESGEGKAPNSPL